MANMEEVGGYLHEAASDIGRTKTTLVDAKQEAHRLTCSAQDVFNHLQAAMQTICPGPRSKLLNVVEDTCTALEIDLPMAKNNLAEATGDMHNSHLTAASNSLVAAEDKTRQSYENSCRARGS